MKKIYMLIAVAFVSASLILSTSSSLRAQEFCPPGTQSVYRAVGYNATGQPVQFLSIENFIPNSPITLFYSDGSAVDGGVTDASGNNPKIVFTGNPVLVSSCNAPGCCAKAIPAAAASCTGVIKNIKYPATQTTPELCCIYVSNDQPIGSVRLFDADQNLIPTVSSSASETNIVGFACYVYPCDALPTSISVCGPLGCCSYQAGSQASLPIKLTSFTAKLTTNNKVILNWISSLEIGSDRYIVERSADGRNFSSIAEVKSAGNTTSTRTYAFTDAGFASIAYYRLKMVDIDDKAEYSKVVYVNLRGGSGVVTQIFPNPFRSDIQLIGISSSDLNRKDIRIFNATGQQVNFKISGANAISIDENAPRGMYILAVKEQRFKLIKE